MNINKAYRVAFILFCLTTLCANLWTGFSDVLTTLMFSAPVFLFLSLPYCVAAFVSSAYTRKGIEIVENKKIVAACVAYGAFIGFILSVVVYVAFGDVENSYTPYRNPFFLAQCVQACSLWFVLLYRILSVGLMVFRSQTVKA